MRQIEPVASGIMIRSIVIRSRALLALVVAVAARADDPPPQPDEPGEWYVYYDEFGARVGRASMDCEGNLGGSDIATSDYVTGFIECP